MYIITFINIQFLRHHCKISQGMFINVPLFKLVHAPSGLLLECALSITPAIVFVLSTTSAIVRSQRPTANTMRSCYPFKPPRSETMAIERVRGTYRSGLHVNAGSLRDRRPSPPRRQPGPVLMLFRGQWARRRREQSRNLRNCDASFLCVRHEERRTATTRPSCGPSSGHPTVLPYCPPYPCSSRRSVCISQTLWKFSAAKCERNPPKPLRHGDLRGNVN